MRILVVSQYFWPENFRVNDLVEGLVARGHGVTVLTGLPNYPGGRFYPGFSWFGPWTESRGALRVVRVPLIPRGGGGAMRLALNYLSFAVAASVLGPFRCRGRFDAIFVHEPSPVTVGIPAVILRALKRAPVFFWVLDLWPESLRATGAVRSERIISAIGRLVRWIYRRCDWVLIQSEAFKDSVESLGVPPDRQRYFPNWAEPDYRPIVFDQARWEGPHLPDGFRLIYAGNVGASQDFPAILSAAERLRGHKDVHWIIIGDGRLSGWVRAEVARRRLQDNVHLWGPYPAARMPELLAAADALLVSLRAEPIFALTVPAKVQAYLATGRPIVAMLDGEGSRIVTQAGAGIACRAGDPEALAATVLQMRSLGPEGRHAMGRKGLAYGQRNFEREMLFRRLESWFAAGSTVNAFGHQNPLGKQ